MDLDDYFRFIEMSHLNDVIRTFIKGNQSEVSESDEEDSSLDYQLTYPIFTPIEPLRADETENKNLGDPFVLGLWKTQNVQDRQAKEIHTSSEHLSGILSELKKT